MRNAFRVLRRDLIRIRRAPKSWAIIIGLLVLPSLYAWVNIVAFWDPYGNADHIKVAVVNQDEGASTALTGEVNVGQQVVDQLKTNDQLGWQFMDHDEAMDAVRSGSSYAAIVMPPDFSRDLLTITTGDFVQPELEYYTNEKANAIAPKITEVGASTLDTQINSNFVGTVAKTIAQEAEKAGTDAGEKLIDSRSETLIALDQALATVQSARMSMTELDGAIGPGAEAAADARRALERVDATIGDVTDAAGDAQGLVNEVQSGLVDFSESLTDAYVSGATNLTGATSRLQESIGQVSGGAGTAQSALTSAQRDVQAVIDSNQALLTALRPIAAAVPAGSPVKSQLDQVIDELEAQTVRDRELLTLLGAAQAGATSVADQTAAATEAMGAVTRSSAALQGMMSGTLPGLNQSMASLSANVGAFSAALDSQRVLVGDAADMLGELESLLGETGTALSSLDGNLGDVQSDLVTLQTDLSAISAADIWDQVSLLTSLDPDSIAGFMSGPVQVHENDLFPVPAYGSSMAPLFTNLSLWIAGFVLMVLFKLEVDTEDVDGLTVRQAYFGRWLLFAVMNLIQSLLVSTGNVVIGVQTVNPVVYIATSVFIGLVYMSIIYALAASFGYIGKGIAVLLVIMQIPGASGIYPIEMMPDFFRSLFPFFPFTYGIDAMRETIGGFYGLNYLKYMAVLALFAALAFAVGIFLRQRLGNFARLFNKKLADTGLFLSEDVQVLGSRRRLTQLVRALTDREKFREDNARRQRWLELNRVNAKRVALVLGLIGTVVLFVVGSFFPDAKATVLGLWGLLLLLVMAAIVVIEYINQNVAYGAEVGELPDEELRRALAEEEAAIRSDARLDQLEKQGAERVNNIVTLIRQDFRQATRNWISAMVLVGVVLIPSFFAWFNVLSSWKPFDNVDNLKVAVASADEGFESNLFPMRLNVGDQVVSQLRANSDIDWQFVTEDDAIEGTKSEEYYAAIVLPPDFSQKMMTFLTPGATPVEIDLYVNEKKNALSSLITGEAASDVSTQINTSFTQTLDEVGLALVSSLATHLEDSDAADTLTNLESAVGRISVQLNSGADTAAIFAVLLSSGETLLSSAGSLASSSSEAIRDTTGAIGQGAGAVTSAQDVLAQASERLSRVFAANAESYETLRTEIDRMLGTSVAAPSGAELTQASARVEEQIAAYTQLRNQLRSQASVAGLDPVTRDAVGLLADRVDGVIDRQQGLKQRLDAAAAPASQGPVDRAATRSAILQDVDAAQAAIAGARDQYTNNLRPQLERLAADLSAVQSDFGGIGQDLRAAEQSLAAGSGSLSAGLADGETAVRLLASDLRDSADTFAELEEALGRAADSGDLSEVKEIIGSSPATFATELASPVSLKTIPVFKVDNFGSQMAPLYTVLGLWVGALLLAVLIKTEVSRESLPALARPLKPWQEYFGRYAIFGGLALLQSTILFVGLIGFVGVRPAHPFLLILAGWTMSFVFSLITYTLVLAFGEAGKAIGVLLLVVQISAGGGAYPLAVLPQWFQNISPFVPVSHATTAVRAAIGGIYDADYWKALGWLLLFTLPFLFIGLVLRLAVRKFNDDLNASLEGTKLMSV